MSFKHVSVYDTAFNRILRLAPFLNKITEFRRDPFVAAPFFNGQLFALWPSSACTVTSQRHTRNFIWIHDSLFNTNSKTKKQNGYYLKLKFSERQTELHTHTHTRLCRGAWIVGVTRQQANRNVQVLNGRIFLPDNRDDVYFCQKTNER